MKRIILSTLVLVGLLMVGCSKPAHVTSASSQAIAINATLDSIQDNKYLAELEPITDELNARLDIVIGHAPEALTIYPPECPMLNWATDALLAEARRYYTGTVDVAIVNIGGLRTPWQAGDITCRNIYELMPFDNELVVLTLSGKDLLELCQIFVEDNGQGIAGMRITAEDKQLIDATIEGISISPDAYYHVATSDYLAGGTDHMTPLKNATEVWRSDLKIRDLYIEYVEQQHTVAARVDGRMTIN